MEQIRARIREKRGVDYTEQQIRELAEKEGLDKIFTAAGFEWRGAGCSMCLAMNPDKLVGREICASSSNSNCAAFRRCRGYSSRT